MSNLVTGIVWELDLPRPEKYVLLALSDHCKEDGSDVYPSIGRIVWKTGYSETQVRGLIGELRKKKILILTHKGGSKPGDTDCYRINIKAARPLPDFKEWSKERRQKEDTGSKTAPINKAMGSKTEPIKEPMNMGTETEPIGSQAIDSNGANNGTGTETEPIQVMGSLLPNYGFTFPPNMGTETEPETRSNRTKNYIEPKPRQIAGDLPLPENPKEAEPTDLRLPGILKAIRACWPKEFKCLIDDADIATVKRMLKRKHDWTGEDLELCIVARFMSESVNPNESVKGWILSVTNYQGGPLSRFREPMYPAGAQFDKWREDACVILYGKRPVQQKLIPKKPLIGYSFPAGLNPIGKSIWLDVTDNLHKKIGHHSWETWIKPTKGEGVLFDVLYVRIPTREFLHIGEKFGDLIKDALPRAIRDVKFVAPEETA